MAETNDKKISFCNKNQSLSDCFQVGVITQFYCTGDIGKI